MQPVISRRLGLECAWNGQVVLGYDADARGRFQRGGAIEENAGLADALGRWRSLIHELIHAHSAGGTQDEYAEYQGWEEGVVENLQRHIRPDTLAAIGEMVDVAVFRPFEDTWRYNRDLRDMEVIRAALGEDDFEGFYVGLLQVPIANRRGYLLARAIQLKNTTAMWVLSEAKSRLTRR